MTIVELDIMEYSNSENLFEPKPLGYRPEYAEFTSIRGRLMCLSALVKKLLKLPFAFAFKLYKTSFKFVGLGVGMGIFLGTLGISKGARSFFHRKAAKVSNDLIDWVLWPFGLLTCVIRLILGAIFHPGIYYNS